MSAYSPTDLLLQSIRDNMNYFPVQQAPIYLYPHLAAWYNNHWPVQSEIRLQWNHTSEDHCCPLQPGQIGSSVRISICYNVRLLFCSNKQHAGIHNEVNPAATTAYDDYKNLADMNISISKQLPGAMKEASHLSTSPVQELAPWLKQGGRSQVRIINRLKANKKTKMELKRHRFLGI